ncbi:hypothetical protein ACK8N7_36505 [Streptomyces griseobrunneus]|uniref:hypothetical protein n=1 Tax=Streptomyces microflavus TaxID=1919 RepID=UPI00382F9C74
MLFEGDDLGKRLQRQTNSWAQLSAEQQERLSVLGVKPAQRVAAAAAGKGAGKTSAAFERGVGGPHAVHAPAKATSASPEPTQKRSRWRARPRRWS